MDGVDPIKPPPKRNVTLTIGSTRRTYNLNSTTDVGELLQYIVMGLDKIGEAVGRLLDIADKSTMD